MARPFRFGVNMVSVADRAEWAAKCRRAETIGFDVVLVPDHLGAPAPFPALVAAADATERVRVGTFVLNAAFWNPTLLARDVATTDALVGGRLELGLGTGYAKAEFDTAGLPWETPGKRVDRLVAALDRLDALLGDASHVPQPVQRPRPRLLLGGHGDRMLALAAARADVVAFTGATLHEPSGALRLATAAALDERVAYLAATAGERAAEIESNILVQAVVVTDDRRAAVEGMRQGFALDYMGVDELLELPTLLVGTVEQIAEQLMAARERFGFSYVCVLEPSMDPMAPVIEKLAGA